MQLKELRKLDGITWQQKWLLQVIIEFEEEGRMGATNPEIAEMMGTSRQVVKKQLKHLEEKGYIIRKLVRNNSNKRLLRRKKDSYLTASTNQQPNKRKYQYVSNKALIQATIKSKEQGKPTNELGQMVMEIVEHYTPSIRLQNEEDHKMCKSSALEYGLQAYKKFDPTRSNNAFAYFSTTVRNGYRMGRRELLDNGKWKAALHINIDDAINK